MKARSKHFRFSVLVVICGLFAVNVPTAFAADSAGLEKRGNAGTSAAPGDNLVINGDFETPPGFGYYSAGQSFSGWTVDYGDVEVVTTLTWAGVLGNQSIDLDGNRSGGISQTLTTSVGQNYVLSFEMAGNPDTACPDPGMIKTMEVWWAGVLLDTVTFDVTGHTGSDLGWAYHEYSVTATDASTQLKFYSLTPGCHGPAIDNVSVQTSQSQVTIDYFALGDSIAAGHGLSNNPENPCRPSELAYPYKVQTMLEDLYQADIKLTSLACSGATALLPDSQLQNPHKWFNNQVDDLIGILSQESQLPNHVVIISVTIGIDDFPWTSPNDMVTILKSSYPDFKNYVDGVSTLITERVRIQLENILHRFPNTKIVVTGYPNPFNQNSIFFKLIPLGCGRALQSCYARVDYGITTLNTAIEENIVNELALTYPGRVSYVDGVYDAFQGGLNLKGKYRHSHDAPKNQCGSSKPGINNTWIQYPGDKLSFSFPGDSVPLIVRKLSGVKAWRGDCVHPNNLGATSYANLVFSAIVALGK